MITLYLARHGQTEENIARIFQGHMPGTLTVEGIAQAEALRDTLRNISLDAVVSSDLKRCVVRPVSRWKVGTCLGRKQSCCVKSIGGVGQVLPLKKLICNIFRQMWKRRRCSMNVRGVLWTT